MVFALMIEGLKVWREGHEGKAKGVRSRNTKTLFIVICYKLVQKSLNEEEVTAQGTKTDPPCLRSSCQISTHTLMPHIPTPKTNGDFGFGSRER